MKKSNNKGFMLLETLIVSTVILSTLVFLYIQFVNVKSSYEVSFRYNTIPGLYMAKEISTFLTENGYISLQTNLDNNLSTNNGYINITNSSNVTGDSDLYTNMITDMNISYVLFVNDDLTTLKTYLSSGTYNTSVFNQEFKKYILKLSTNATNKYRLIVSFNDNTFASILIGGE